MSEEWKAIEGYEGLYSISSTGRVRRDTGGKGSIAGRILTPKGVGRKYRHVDLSKDDVKTRFLIHRLVAIAFIGPAPFDDAQVNHLNFDGADNRVENLEWTTPQENVAHSIEHGRTGGRPMPGVENGRAKLSEEDVVCILRLKGKEGQWSIAQRYGVARSLVQRIHQRRAWSHINPAEWPKDLRVREWPA